jgi:tetratricopeptide (TPR) repeat protein
MHNTMSFDISGRSPGAEKRQLMFAGNRVTQKERVGRPAICTLKIVLVTLTVFGFTLAQQYPSEDHLLQIAAQHIETGDFVGAADLVRKVLAGNPNSSIAYNLLGVCLARAGDIEGARNSFQKALELNPQLAPAHVNLGKLLIRTLEEAAAIQQFKAAIAIDPEILIRDPASYSAFNIFGLCLMSDGKYEEARRAFERVIHINPRYVPAHVNMGNVLVALRRDAAALNEFLEAITMQPNDLLALKNIGLIYGRQEKFDLAMKYLERARRLAPRDLEINVALAGAEISAGKGLEARRVIAELVGAVELGPKNRETLGLLWLDKGEPQNAADLVRDDPGLAAQFYTIGYEKAETEFDAGRYQSTRKILEAIRDLRTPDAAFHDLLGSAYYAIDDPKKASQEFQQAVRLEPADPEHYFKLGMVFLKHRTADPAIYVYETALKSRPDVPKLWFGLGLSHYLAFRPKEAEQALRKALALDPHYDAAYVVLGDLLEQNSRPADALDVFRKAMQMRPDLYLPYYYYGKLTSKKGNEERADAIASLRKAVSLNPTFSEARFELGKALAQAGETSEAIQQLNKSLELNPDLAQSHYQLARIYKTLDDRVRSSEQLRLFEESNKKAKPEDLIQRLEVQIEKP